MANHQEWEDIGRSIQNIVDQAVSSRDYQKLNQTIRQTVDKAMDMGGEAIRKTVDTASRQTVSSADPIGVSRQGPEKNLPVLYGKTGKQAAGGVVKILGGSVLSCVSFATLVTSAAMQWILAQTGLGSILLSTAGLGLGIGLITGGVRTMERLSRFKTYKKVLGQKTHCKLEKLARSVRKSEKFVRRELNRMIRDGLFTEGHMDKEQTLLITSDETYQYFEESRLALEQRQKLEAARHAQIAAVHTPEVQEILNKGDVFLDQIRSCNDAIPGVEISAKIHRMENIIQKIFDRVEACPEVVPDLKKMMDYYLPMTVKLLRAYSEMDAQPVQGETIEGAKREIENTLDTLNQAFEKLLDTLFADTALDISSDISVLNTLLAQEGLTEDTISTKKNK